MKPIDMPALIMDIKAAKKKAAFLSPDNCRSLVRALTRALIAAKPPISTTWRRLRKTLENYSND